MKSEKLIIGKILYAILFLLILPILLFAWAILTENIIFYDVGIDSEIGFIIGIVGLALICWGMVALAIYGKGLPMNAYPPPHYVKKGPYRFFKHPIYWGFGILTIGIAKKNSAYYDVLNNTKGFDRRKRGSKK